MTALDQYAFAKAAADAVRADELSKLAGYAAANRYANTYTSAGNNAVQAEILAQRNREENQRSYAASQQAAQAQKNREAELRVQDANIGRLMQGRATTPWEQAQEYSAARAQYFGYGSTPTSPQSTQKPNAPQPTIQMQQAKDTRIPWSTRVQTYADYLRRTQPSLNPIYARNEAIALIGPDPATVPVKVVPVAKPSLRPDQEALLARQALNRETARLDEIGRSLAAAKNPAAASQAEYAQRVLAFGNAPAVTPPSTVPKPLSVRAPITRTLETVAYQEDIAVAALREAIAKGAVLASIVKKASSNKNKSKKPTGSKSTSKKPLTKLKK